MGFLLDRYRDGEFHAVWKQLASSPAEDVAQDAQAVAEETMRRVRRNLETIVERLRGIGYRFGWYADGSVVPGYVGPLGTPIDHRELEASVSSIEAAAGPIPVSLKVFWKVVGEVDLTGSWESSDAYLDPLVVYGPDAVLLDFDDWLSETEVERARHPFLLPVSPDIHHKDNVSGGPPYGIRLPCDCWDAPLLNEWHDTTFVGYLRISILQFAGFPGASEANPLKTQRHQLSARLLDRIASIREGLHPF